MNTDRHESKQNGKWHLLCPCCGLFPLLDPPWEREPRGRKSVTCRLCGFLFSAVWGEESLTLDFDMDSAATHWAVAPAHVRRASRARRAGDACVAPTAAPAYAEAGAGI